MGCKQLFSLIRCARPRIQYFVMLPAKDRSQAWDDCAFWAHFVQLPAEQGASPLICEYKAAAAPAAATPADACWVGVIPAAVPAVLAAVAASADCWALVMPVRLLRAVVAAPATQLALLL